MPIGNTSKSLIQPKIIDMIKASTTTTTTSTKQQTPQEQNSHIRWVEVAAISQVLHNSSLRRWSHFIKFLVISYGPFNCFESIGNLFRQKNFSEFAAKIVQKVCYRALKGVLQYSTNQMFHLASLSATSVRRCWEPKCPSFKKEDDCPGVNTSKI